MSYHYPSQEPRRDTSEDEFYSDIHLCLWEGKHCEEWASQVCQKRGVDIIEVDLRGFRAIKNGITLQQLTRQQFCSLVGDQYGAMFFKELMSYRAMQKHRCSRCVSSETTHSMSPVSNHFGIQEMASDLSSANQKPSMARISSPSPPPPPFYHDYVSYSSYKDQLSPASYEGRARCPGELSPTMTYEENPSPGGYHERTMSPEYSHQHLPPTPESYNSHSQSPQLIYPDQIYRKGPDDPEVASRPRKPLPQLLPIESEDEDLGNAPHETHHVVGTFSTTDRRYERVQPNPANAIQVFYSTHPTMASRSTSHHHHHPHHPQHPNYIIRPSSLHPSQSLDGHRHTRIIHYVHPHHPRHPTHVSHPARGSHPAHNIMAHVSNASINSYESDDDGDESPEEESSGRLVIDIREEEEDPMEHNEAIIEMDDRSSRPTQEIIGPFPHLQKIPTKRKRDRGPKSWEFLMRLLACPKTNPSIIRWEDEGEGSFRLVQPQEIANMWGTRSKKEELSYNNFARALRYHYKTKLLYKISERQLVYGCGPVALAFYQKLINEGDKSPLGISIG